MQVSAASEPGSPDRPNEDAVLVTAGMVAVLDGTTVRTATGCVHGLPWFVDTLAAYLAKNKSLAPSDALSAAIAETAETHSATCDLSHPGTPSAFIAIVQVHECSLRYLVLGDVTLVLDTVDGLRIITDNRVRATALAERAEADALPADSPAKAEALVRMKHAELAARNVPGGFWIAGADPTVVEHALTGTVPVKAVSRVALLTDGAARAVDTFKVYDWPDFFTAVTADGPSKLIERVRIAEDADPMGIRQPRNKIHDDATVAVIEL